MSVKCRLCRGTGDNETGITMKVNNNLCPRCGGYGTIPDGCSDGNERSLTEQDNQYIDGNGRVGD